MYNATFYVPFPLMPQHKKPFPVGYFIRCYSISIETILPLCTSFFKRKLNLNENIIVNLQFHTI